jgi:hypothetical protein
MKRLVILMLAVILMAGCETQADKDARKEAELQANLAVIRSFRDLQNQLHEQYVTAAFNLFGESASRVLTQCYLDGYDTVQNDDHTFGNDSKLGPKYIAKCDKIVSAIKKNSDREEKRHEREIAR